MKSACNNFLNNQLEEIQKFVEQVTNVVSRQLIKYDKNASFKVKLEDLLFTFFGTACNEKITLSLLAQDAEKLRLKSPFALDQWLWQQLSNLGIKIDTTSHYFKTVEILSEIRPKEQKSTVQLSI